MRRLATSVLIGCVSAWVMWTVLSVANYEPPPRRTLEDVQQEALAKARAYRAHGASSVEMSYNEDGISRESITFGEDPNEPQQMTQGN